VEEQRPGSYFPVLENDRGTFIFNSKDLCLLEYLPELINAGVDSLKIEGRMKGINYVASVIRAYREALDSYRENPETYVVKKEWLDELKKISHRGYTSGFLFGPPGQEDHEYQTGYLRSHEFVGVVTELSEDGSVIIEVRNRICADDELEFIGRGMASHRFSMSEMTSESGNYPLTVAHPNQRIRLRVPFHVEPLDLVRREKLP